MRALYEKLYAERPEYRMKQWRQDAYREWLMSLERRGEYLLDVGCGRGESLAIARELGFLAMGVEIVPALCNSDDVALIESAASLPYPDGGFDVVTAMDVLEHLEEREVRLAIGEMWRVCRGDILIGVPHMQDGFGSHLTIQPREWWHAAIESATAAEAELWDYPVPKIKQPYSFFTLHNR